jgi:hypothetical protein
LISLSQLAGLETQLLTELSALRKMPMCAVFIVTAGTALMAPMIEEYAGLLAPETEV